MRRFYFYNRRTDIKENLKGDIIDFSLSALYSTRAYSQKLRKEVSQFHYFDEVKLCLSTKTPGVYHVRVSTGTDGSTGHMATSLKELKENLFKDNFNLVSERDYLRLRRMAFLLIFKHVNFFKPTEFDATRKFFYENSWSRGFYDVKLISISEKKNIRNYPESTIKLYEDHNWKLNDCRIDEDFRIFISKDKKYKCNTFEIESSHFNPYYENVEDFKKGNVLNFKENRVECIKDFQFERLKKIIIELILVRSDLDISKILSKQISNITILDI